MSKRLDYRDYIGKKYGLLLVTGYGGIQAEKTCVTVKCDCGSLLVVRLSNLKSGMSTSCGCIRAASIKAVVSTYSSGATSIPEYGSWVAARNRCFNSTANNYHNYGGRGITMCDSWAVNFFQFLKDMGPKPTPAHTLERKNNDGNYEPSNCIWATRKEQRANQRPRTYAKVS